MDRANEFDPDFFYGFGEVVDAFTSPDTKGLNQFDRKIFGNHVKSIMVYSNKVRDLMNMRQKKIIHRFDLNKFLEDKQSNQSMIVYDFNHQTIPEDVFFCPRHIADKTEIEIFFISKEYNVNFASDSFTNPIAARFLFAEDQYLLAIAEEPATEVSDYSQRDIENLYMERRRGKQPGKFSSFPRTYLQCSFVCPAS